MPVIICVDSHRSNWKNNHEPHRLPLLLVRSETVSFYPIPATPSAQFVGPCPHTFVSGALFLSVSQCFLFLNSSGFHFAAISVLILQLLLVIYIYTVSSSHVLQVSLKRFLMMSLGSKLCFESHQSGSHAAQIRKNCRPHPEKRRICVAIASGKSDQCTSSASHGDTWSTSSPEPTFNPL